MRRKSKQPKTEPALTQMIKLVEKDIKQLTITVLHAPEHGERSCILGRAVCVSC